MKEEAVHEMSATVRLVVLLSAKLDAVAVVVVVSFLLSAVVSYDNTIKKKNNNSLMCVCEREWVGGGKGRLPLSSCSIKCAVAE